MGERMAQLDLVLWLAGGKDVPEWASMPGQFNEPFMWWLRPMLLGDAPALLKISAVDIEAAGAPDAATANAKLATTKNIPLTRSWWNIMLRNPNLSRLVARRYQAILLRRQAAVAMAARLFEIKYGRKPNSVQELVPEFLKEAPLDPVVGGGAVVFMPAAPTTRPNRY